MSALINDGSIPYGSEVVTIGGKGFVAESIESTNPTSFIERRNQLNEPSGGVLIQDFITGTAVLQLEDSSATAPLNGMTFLSGSVTYFLSQVSEPKSQGEAKKVNISFRKKIN